MNLSISNSVLDFADKQACDVEFSAIRPKVSKSRSENARQQFPTSSYISLMHLVALAMHIHFSLKVLVAAANRVY
jgi:hypothetical protein